MNDTIYRDEAVEICERWRQRAKKLHDRDGWYMADILLRFIEELPPANRPRGEWIRINGDWIDGPCGARYFPIRCSVCGYSTYDDDATKYCPNCGARMKGADDEDCH